MTKRNILKIAVPSVAALAAAAIFCGAYYNSSDPCPSCGAPGCPEGRTCSVCMNDNYPNVIGQTRYCTHPIDTEYTEPTVKPGKYYLNGDINSAYMEVTENTWQIIPAENSDIQELYRSALNDEETAENLEALKTSPDENFNVASSLDENSVAFYSAPHEYTVVTWHVFDIVWLCPGPGESLRSTPQTYWQNGVGYPGPTLVDENTVHAFCGDFILVE